MDQLEVFHGPKESPKHPNARSLRCLRGHFISICVCLFLFAAFRVCLSFCSIC